MCNNITIKKALEIAVNNLRMNYGVSQFFGSKKKANEINIAADILSLEHESVKFEGERKVRKQVCVYCDEFRENCDCYERHGFSGVYTYVKCIERKMITEKLEILSREELVYEKIED